MSSGMWAHYLSAENYQALLDRGWRRSGRLVVEIFENGFRKSAKIVFEFL